MTYTIEVFVKKKNKSEWVAVTPSEINKPYEFKTKEDALETLDFMLEHPEQVKVVERMKCGPDD